MSFADARSNSVSDEFTVDDLVTELRFERGTLSLDLDYVRGRLVKTRMDVHADGSVVIDTVNRGKSLLRWLERLRGKKHLEVVE